MTSNNKGLNNNLQPKDTEFIGQDLNEFVQNEDGEVLPPNEAYKEIRDIVSKCRIGLDDDLHPPEYVLSIDDCPVFGLNDFSLIIGKAKSRKSFLMTLLMSVFLCRVIENIESQSYNGKKRLIWFDTEQSGYYVQRMFQRAVKLAKIDNAPQLEVYSLRPFSPKERKDIISQVLDFDNPDNDILFSIIDGIRDLVTDINDQDQATDIGTWLLKITAEKGIHVTNVLHQNKGDNNARGHLGSELTNKAQVVISVSRDEKDKDVSIVTPEFCRDKEFNPFAFTISEEGLPELAEYAPKVSKSKKFNPYDVEIDFHKRVCNDVFSGKSEYGYTDLWRHIKNVFAKNNQRIGDNTSKDIVTHWMEHNLIKKEGNTRNVKYYSV